MGVALNECGGMDIGCDMVTKMFGDLDFEAMDREDAEADECLRRLRVAQQPLIRKTFDPDEQQHAIVVEPTPKRIDGVFGLVRIGGFRRGCCAASAPLLGSISGVKRMPNS